MNLDNQRLKEIQLLKNGYTSKILTAESEAEVNHYYKKLDELEAEELKILKNCNVII